MAVKNFYRNIGHTGALKVRRLLAEGNAPECPFCHSITVLDEDSLAEEKEPEYSCKCGKVTKCTKQFLENLSIVTESTSPKEPTT